ncbi:MAG: lipase family alpha/beta hydrolase [Solirubrobacterales bacterium]
MTATPDTIVLVHGFWVTPLSWEDWIAHYEAKGFKVIAPAYPGLEGSVESLNEDPSPILDLELPAIVDSFKAEIDALDAPPIIIGHSAGGLITQLLLADGYGAAGVAICSVAPEGVKVAPPSQAKATKKALLHPSTRHKVIAFTEEEWKYAFGTSFTEERSRETYERYAIPGSGHILWQGILANFQPGHQVNWLDFKNEERPPLLIISGSDDTIMPEAVQKSNAKHYKLDTPHITFPGPHLLPGADNWQEVADYSLTWALEQVTGETVTELGAESAT